MFDAQDFAQRLADRQDRWSLLQEFVAEWHAPLQDGDGFSAEEIDAAEQRLGLRLPLALCELYSLAGRRDDLLANDPYILLGPDDLTWENGILPVLVESQAAVDWGIRCQDLHLMDPPVVIGNGGWIECNSALSEFILQMILLQTMFAEIGGNAQFDGRTQDIIERNFVPFGFPDWPGYPSRLYGSTDTLIYTADCQWISVAARNSEALSRTVSLLNLEWNVLYDGVPVP